MKKLFGFNLLLAACLVAIGITLTAPAAHAASADLVKELQAKLDEPDGLTPAMRKLQEKLVGFSEKLLMLKEQLVEAAIAQKKAVKEEAEERRRQEEAQQSGPDPESEDDKSGDQEEPIITTNSSLLVLIKRIDGIKTELTTYKKDNRLTTTNPTAEGIQEEVNSLVEKIQEKIRELKKLRDSLNDYSSDRNPGGPEIQKRGKEIDEIGRKAELHKKAYDEAKKRLDEVLSPASTDQSATASSQPTLTSVPVDLGKDEEEVDDPAVAPASDADGKLKAAWNMVVKFGAAWLGKAPSIPLTKDKWDALLLRAKATLDKISIRTNLAQVHPSRTDLKDLQLAYDGKIKTCYDTLYNLYKANYQTSFDSSEAITNYPLIKKARKELLDVVKPKLTT